MNISEILLNDNMNYMDGNNREIRAIYNAENNSCLSGL